jgi:uncharacterized protein YjbI with pentapeptide repeats
MKTNHKTIYLPNDIEKFRTKDGENSFDFTDVVFECEIDFQVILFHNKFDNVCFRNSIFKNNVSFTKTVFKHAASFEKSMFYDDVSFTKTSFNGIVDFSEAQFKNDVYFTRTNFSSEAYFFECIFEKNAHFLFAQFYKFAGFYKSIFDNEANFVNAYIKGPVDFSEVKFKSADFSGLVIEQHAIFNEIEIKDLSRETCRIIKHEFLKNNNRIEALRFYQKEMKSYYKEMISKKWYKHIPEIIILSLNWISNNYGLSWIRSVVFTVGIGTLFYFLYLHCVGTSFTWEQFVQFLNPAHSYDIIEGAYVVDGLARIFVGYGYYQTISAFRKHRL